MRQSWVHQTLIVIVAAVVLFTNLGGVRLWDQDEPRNAGCTLEMLERDDWIVPVFNGELRGHKPILLYWLMMTSYAVFGVSEFAARFWSAVLAIGTALATYQIGKKLFDPMVGLWAGVILTTTLMFDVAGRAATPDSALIFFSTLALMIYVLTGFDSQKGYFPRSWFAVALMYAAMGVATLAKGPVGIVLPTAVIGMFLLIMRMPARPPESVASSWWKRWLGLLRPFAPAHFLGTCWYMRPVTAVLVAGAVALPWYLWVGVRTEGEFWRQFFLVHNVGRAAAPMEGHHGPLLFYYPAAILFGFFPWSVFAAPTGIEAVVRWKRRERIAPGIVLASCWIGVYVGLFSLAQTKLPSYVTPCYPALALLTALHIRRWTLGESVVAPIWNRLVFAVLGLVGLGLAIGLPLATRHFLPGEGWLGLLGMIPLAGAAIGLWLIHHQRRHAAAFTFSVTATAFVTALFGFALLRVDRHQQNHVLLEGIARHSTNPTVASYRTLESTLVFYGRRTIAELHQPQAAEAFLAAEEERFLISTRTAWEQELRPIFSARATVLAECPLFLKNDDLLLITYPPEALRMAEDRQRYW